MRQVGRLRHAVPRTQCLVHVRERTRYLTQGILLLLLLLAACLLLSLCLAGRLSAASREHLPQATPTLAAGVESGLNVDRTLSAAQRWYGSILTQQRLISERVEDMRTRLHDNLLSTQEFLDEVSLLFERTDRLYVEWKRLADPVKSNSGHASVTSQPDGSVVTQKSETQKVKPHRSETVRPRDPGARRPANMLLPTPRDDVAVGKSLNYLRLSLINFFLGYCDSNGKQIDDAEKQVLLSKLWRTRSLLFIKALDS